MSVSFDLNFLGGDPGAVKYGNFNNYYLFNNVDRIKELPKNIGGFSKDEIVCLDIGCNSGNLTEALYEHLAFDDIHGVPPKKVSILAVDLDPSLIEKAICSNKYTQNITYVSLDVCRPSSNAVFAEYLARHKRSVFDAVFCFSVTMWIHLNNGDAGLKQFLLNMAKLTEILVLEPQPWKCYRSALRRVKRVGGDFPLFDSLTMTRNVESDMDNIVTNECGFQKVTDSIKTNWDRKLHIFIKK